MSLRKKIGLGLLGVVVLLGIAAGALYWYQSQAEKNVTIESSTEKPIFDLATPDAQVDLWYLDLDNPDDPQSHMIIRSEQLENEPSIYAEWIFSEETDQSWIEPTTGNPILTKNTSLQDTQYLLLIDYRKDPITFTHINPEDNINTEKTIDIPEGKTLDSNSFHISFQGYDFTRTEPFVYKTIITYGGSYDGKVMTMQAEVMGIETKTTPAGTFECYKVGFKPVGVYSLLPGATFNYWYSTDEPHHFVESDAQDFRMQLAKIGEE
jgi:hypothetical protein